MRSDKLVLLTSGSTIGSHPATHPSDGHTAESGENRPAPDCTGSGQEPATVGVSGSGSGSGRPLAVRIFVVRRSAGSPWSAGSPTRKRSTRISQCSTSMATTTPAIAATREPAATKGASGEVTVDVEAVSPATSLCRGVGGVCASVSDA